MVDTVIQHRDDKDFRNAYNSILRTLFACVKDRRSDLNLAVLAIKLLTFQVKYGDFDFKPELCNEKNCGYKYSSRDQLDTDIKAATEVLTTFENKVTAVDFPWDEVSHQASSEELRISPELASLVEPMSSLSNRISNIETVVIPQNADSLAVVTHFQNELTKLKSDLQNKHDKHSELYAEYVALMVIPGIHHDDYRTAYTKILSTLANYFADDLIIDITSDDPITEFTKAKQQTEQTFRLQLLSFEGTHGPLYLPEYFFANEEQAQSLIAGQRQFVLNVLNGGEKLTGNEHKNGQFTHQERIYIQQLYTQDLEVQEAFALATAERRVDTFLDLADKQLVTAFRKIQGFGQVWEKYLYHQEGDATDNPQQRANNLRYILNNFMGVMPGTKPQAPSDILVCNTHGKLEELITLTRNAPALMYDLLLAALLQHPEKYNRKGDNNPNIMRILKGALSVGSNEAIDDMDARDRVVPKAVVFNNLLLKTDEYEVDTTEQRNNLFKKLIFTKEFCKALTETQIVKMAELDTTGEIAKDLLFASDWSYTKRSGKLTQNGIQTIATQYLSVKKTEDDIAKLNARLKKPSLLNRFIAWLTGSNFYKYANDLDLPLVANYAEQNRPDREALVVVPKTTKLFAKAYFSANPDEKLAAKLKLFKMKDLDLKQLNEDVKKLSKDYVGVKTGVTLERFEADKAVVKRIGASAAPTLLSINTLNNSSDDILATYYLDNKTTDDMRKDILSNPDLCKKLLSTQNQDQAQRLARDQNTTNVLVEIYKNAKPDYQEELSSKFSQLFETANLDDLFRQCFNILLGSSGAAATSASTSQTSEDKASTATPVVSPKPLGKSK